MHSQHKTLRAGSTGLWEAQDKDELLSLETTFTPAQLQTFKNELCALAQGRTFFEEAGTVAERIRSQVEQSTYPVNGDQIAATLSLGVSAVLEPKSETESQHLIKQADNALYKAKENGRNPEMGYEKTLP